jgi:hypothetical protein
MLMHLQATVDYDHFARALSIGPETMVMDFRPGEPMHSRYAVTHNFLSSQAGWETETVSKVVNAFFGWEFNSCEMLVKGDDVHPIDYANACPDVALTSLHYYFPWAMTALVRWSAYCLVTGRKSFIGVRSPRAYFDIADDDALDYQAKMQAYRALADQEFDSASYWQWCEDNLSHLPERVLEWVDSKEFDRLLVDTVRATYPRHEHEQFLAHFRGLTGLWVKDQKNLQAAG